MAFPQWIQSKTWFIWTVALTALFLIVNLVIYVGLEQPIYTWDFKGYWKSFGYNGNLLLTNPLWWVLENAGRVRFSDYNPLPVTLLFPFYILFGPSRLVYLVALLSYLLLLSALVSFFIARLSGSSRRFSLLAFVLTALCVPFLATIVRGFPDIVGLIPMVGSLIFIRTQDLSGRLEWRRAVVLGLLLWIPFLMRRWYAYSVVSLYLTLPVLSFLLFVSHQKSTKWLRSGRNLLGNFALAGVVTVFSALVFQYGLVVRILTTDYSVAYSAYQRPFGESLRTTWDAIGGVGVFLAIGSLVLLLCRPRRVQNVWALFFVINLMLTFVLFTRTQAPGMHHILPFVLWLLLLTLLGLELLTLIVRPSLKKVIVGGLVLASAGAVILSFHRWPAGGRVWGLPAATYPLAVENYHEYQRLADTLEELTAQGDQVATFAWSVEVFDDFLNPLSDERLATHQVPITQIDMRDGLRLDFVQARYVVVGDPDHLVQAQGQVVLSITEAQILSGEGIGAAYERLSYEFVLSGGKRAFIYEKVRPFTSAEIEAFVEQFLVLYPEWHSLYASSFAGAYVGADLSLGREGGKFTLRNPSEIIAAPGEETPTVATLVYPADSLVIRSTNKISFPGWDGTRLTIRDHTGQEQEIEITDRAPHAVDMSSFKGKEVTFILDKKGNAQYDELSLTY